MKPVVPLKSREMSCLKLIPRNAGRIALVGIEAVHIGTAFRRLSPNCHQERFPNLKRLKLHIADQIDFVDEYDAVVLAGQMFKDQDLKSDLDALGSVLSEDGLIIAEILNPFFFLRLEKQLGKGKAFPVSFIKALITKTQAYSQALRRNITDGGFRIERLARDDVAVFSRWLQHQKEVTPSMASELDQLSSAIKSSRFLLCLNTDVVPQLRIQAQVLKPIGGVNDVRIGEPLGALSSMPGVLCHIQRGQKIVQGHKDLRKIFLWHRPVLSFEKSLAHIQSLRRAGYLIVTEFDDHYSPWPKIEKNSFLSFAGVHAIQTTNDELAHLFSAFNPEVAVFPNQLDVFPDRDLSEPSPVCRIFFGALNRRADWRPIMPMINKMLSTVMGSFHFDVIMDQEFFDVLETDNKEFTPRCSYEEYKKHLMAADVSLMPLLDTVFNRTKSDLKLVEAAGCGAVPLASSLVYKAADPRGEFAVICETPDQFMIGLKVLIEEKDNRLARQIKGREYVRRSRMISQHVQSRYDWLLDVSSRREELDKALEKRLAAIAPK